MQKILQLSSKQWLGGVSPSNYDQQSALLSAATSGVSGTGFISNPERDGLLEAGVAVEEITDSGTTINNVQDATYRAAGSDYEYALLLQSGDIWTWDLTEPISFTKYPNPGTVETDFSDGQIEVKPSSFYGTEKYIVATSGDLYNAGFAGNEASYEDLGNTGEPMHVYYDKVYQQLDSDGVDETYYDGTAYVNNNNVLTLPGNGVAVTDDGTYMVFATESNDIVFWDSYSTSWNRSYKLPPNTEVYGLTSNRGGVYILTDSGVMFGGYSTPPKYIVSFADNSGSKPAEPPSPQAFNFHFGIHPFRDGIIYVNDNNGITFVGSARVQDDGYSVHNILSGLPSGDKEILGVTEDQIIVNVRNTSLHRFTTSASVPASRTNQAAETRVIDLDNIYDVNAIDLVFDEALSGNDSIKVSIRSNTSEAYTDLETITSTDSQYYRVYNDTTAGNKYTAMQVKLTFLGGDPRVMNLEILGDKVSK